MGDQKTKHLGSPTILLPIFGFQASELPIGEAHVLFKKLRIQVDDCKELYKRHEGPLRQPRPSLVSRTTSRGGPQPGYHFKAKIAKDGVPSYQWNEFLFSKRFIKIRPKSISFFAYQIHFFFPMTVS
jgi:hypothetical protein